MEPKACQKIIIWTRAKVVKNILKYEINTSYLHNCLSNDIWISAASNTIHYNTTHLINSWGRQRDDENCCWHVNWCWIGDWLFLAIMDMVWKIEIPTPTNNIIAAHTSSYSRHKAENKPFHHKIHEKWNDEAMKQPWWEEFETWSGVYFCILMSVAESPVTNRYFLIRLESIKCFL